MESMSQAIDLSDDLILVRMSKGQRELVIPSARLTPWERRFLACTTGFTPLGVLLDRGLDSPESVQGITRLLRLDLLTPAEGQSRQSLCPSKGEFVAGTAVPMTMA